MEGGGGAEEPIYQNSHENSPLVPPQPGRRGRHGGGRVPGHHSWPFSQSLALDPTSLLTAEVLGRVERAGGAFMPPTPTPGCECLEACFPCGELQVGRGRGALLPLKLLQAPPEPVLGRSLVSI